MQFFSIKYFPEFSGIKNCQNQSRIIKILFTAAGFSDLFSPDV